MTRPLHVDIRRRSAYAIIFDTKLAEIPRALARRPLGRRHFVISDTNVARLYGKRFVAALHREGLEASLLVVPAGERSKARQVKELLEDRLLAQGAHRDSVIIALGGGMIGDLAGFTAATLHRGLPLVQVPTSLLAQVDSSVGGKVAVDHRRGKNLIGAFYQPARVYIDTAALKTLPAAEFRSGLAEVIKYGAIMDARLFAHLEAHAAAVAAGKPAVLSPVVRRCCDLKREVVQADERESGLRRILNFGHTIGHAVETLSRFRMRHGEAVALGMCTEAWLGVALGVTRREAAVRLEQLVRRYGLPEVIPPRFAAEEVVRATRLDKKAVAGTVRYTLLRSVGRAEPGVAIAESDVVRLLRLSDTLRKA